MGEIDGRSQNRALDPMSSGDPGRRFTAETQRTQRRTKAARCARREQNRQPQWLFERRTPCQAANDPVRRGGHPDAGGFRPDGRPRRVAPPVINFERWTPCPAGKAGALTHRSAIATWIFESEGRPHVKEVNGVIPAVERVWRRSACRSGWSDTRCQRPTGGRSVIARWRNFSVRLTEASTIGTKSELVNSNSKARAGVRGVGGAGYISLRIGIGEGRRP
jgi:hypothetical protein